MSPFFAWGEIEHLVAAMAVAALALQSWSSDVWRDGRSVHCAAFLAATPLVALVLPASAEAFFVGKEGLTEVITEGLLLALVVEGARRRQGWIALGALALLLEEADYGQWWSRVETPAWLEDAGSDSGNMNTHNIPVLQVWWRLGPLLACMLLAIRERWPERLEAFALSARLPSLHSAFVAAVGVQLVLSFLSAFVSGDDIADEAGELAAVAMVALAWRAAEETNA